MEEKEKINTDNIKFSEDDNEIILDSRDLESNEQVSETVEEPQEEVNAPEDLPMETHPAINYYNYTLDMESGIRRNRADIDNILNHLINNNKNQEDK